MADENDGTAALAAKNAELLTELKAAKARIKEFEGLDLEGLKASATELKARKQKDMEEKQEYEKLFAQQKEDHAKELAAKQKALDEAQASVRGIVVDAKLRSALAKSNVDPLMMDAAVDMLSHKVAVTESGGERQVRLGDKDVGEWVAEWSKSDVGKRFTLADTGSGSGTPPGAASNGHDTIKKGDWDQYFDPNSPSFSMMTQAKLLDEDPNLFEALTKKYDAAVLAKMKAGGFGRG